MINSEKIVHGLRALAAELKPFTHEVGSGSLVWNGGAYVKAMPQHADPYALAWWSTLTSIADMIECQNAPLTQRQIDYLRNKLFSGMGSLRDQVSDKELDEQLDELFFLLKY